MLVPSATLAGDDFEFGRALAKMGQRDSGYFDYARRVFNRVINDPNSSEEEKDLCRYGLAEMKRAEAMGATARDEVPYADVVKLFTDAIGVMESFVKKNPKHPRAAEAQLQVGTTRLGFVQWARESLLPDPAYMAERGTKPDEVKQEATGMVRGAIRYFDGLRKGHDSMDATQMQQLAQYYWVLCQYYLALVYDPGSPEAKDAFQEAAKQLDDFISLNDGQLLAIYAQDIFGLTHWEMAKIAESEEDQVKHYRRAIEWFETCIESPNEGPEWERVITNGYYHLGQACLEAGRLGGENFHRLGATYLKTMEERHPTAWRQDNGIRALLEWAKIEMARDRQSDAVDIAKRAGEYAKKLGKSYLEALANRQLRIMLAGGSRGTGSIKADPTVLKRVADDFFLEKKWGDAISAYMRVIAAVPRTRENAETYLIPTWERIGKAYKEQGDLLASALSYEPVHEIWIDGLVPKTGAEDDPNMIRLGYIRLRAQQTWKQLFDLTQSQVYGRQFKRVRGSFAKDYQGHPSSQAGQWNSATEAMNEARAAKTAKDSKWRSLVKKADEGFREVAKDMKSPKQDAALVALITSQYLRENWQGMLNAVKDAFAFWDSSAAKAQAKQFPTVAQRRKLEKGKALFWKAEAEWRMKKWDEVLKTLDGWHVEYDKLKGGRYYSGALGHMVMAHVGKGDIPASDKPYRKLLKEDPKYFRLPKITFGLADHFNDKAREIDKDRKAALIKLKGTAEAPLSGARTRLRTTDRNETRAVELLADLQARKGKLEELVAAYDKAKADGVDGGIEKADYDEAKKEIPQLEQRIKDLTEKANRLRAEREALEKEVTELDKQIRGLGQQLYEPIVKAANYFKDWDDALIVSGQKRMAKNVEIFGDLFFKAAQLRPDVPENWAKANQLYEDYLKLPDADDAKKRLALARLGTIYARLAAAADEGSEERGALVQKALDRLQGSIAKIPENNELVVGVLAGDLVVIPWQRQAGDKRHRFALPRVSTVEEFQRAVSSLGEPSGTKLPIFKTEVDNKRYQNAVGYFKQFVDEQMTQAELERTVKGFEIAGFDMPFYRLHAESSAEFRMALAWIYSESGQFENMMKARNLADSLVQGRFAEEENSERWWEAQVIKLRAFINGADLKIKASSGAADPTAAEWVRRASKMIRGLNTSSPELGDDVRPQTRGELKKALNKLETLRERVGLKPLNLILDKLPDPDRNK